MAYKKEIITKAENFFVAERLGYSGIAKRLGINRWQTVYDWAKKWNWGEKRNRIVKKSDEIAEEELISQLSTTKGEYKTKNVKRLDDCIELLNKIINGLSESFEKDPDLALNLEFVKMLTSTTVTIAKIVQVQDHILFNKNVGFSSELNINVDEFIKRTIEYTESKGPIKFKDMDLE